VEYLLVCLVAFGASALTLYSGFGLGTLLLPVFALFFPIPVAVAATAVVHLANNLFKVGLVGRNAERSVVLRFGIPAVIAALIGAVLLGTLGSQPPLAEYLIGDRAFEVTTVKVVVGLVIVVFAVLELTPAFGRLQWDRKYLPVGGAVSGFFGGLSGHQGALRSAFLVKAGMQPASFVGTNTVTAVMVDIARLLVYGVALLGVGVVDLSGTWGLVVAGSLSAFAGAYLASRYLHKVTMRTVQRVVAVMLIGVGTAMAVGLI
jgi:uncharacterized protein